MEYRSTNPTGFVHFGGDVVSNVHSSHGIRLSGGSTGGLVESVGDDTGAALLVQAKGAAGVTVGNASNTVTLTGSSLTLNSTALTIGTTASIIQLGASTATLKGIRYVTSTFSQAAISSGQIAEVTFASTTFDVSPGDLVSVSFISTLGAAVLGGYRLSTAAASRVTILLTTPGSSASSTLSGTMCVAYVDMT